MQALLYIAYLGLGLFQLVAIVSGLEDWIGLHWLLAIVVAFFLAYIPVVGTIVGMFGAVTAWHWSWLQAGALFFGPFAAIVILALGTGLLGKHSSK